MNAEDYDRLAEDCRQQDPRTMHYYRAMAANARDNESKGN
jgi:hypothetical protein